MTSYCGRRPPRRSDEERVYGREQVRSAEGALHAPRRLALLEEDERRQAPDLEPVGDVGVLLCVDFDDAQPALSLGAHLAELADHVLARTTPYRFQTRQGLF